MKKMAQKLMSLKDSLYWLYVTVLMFKNWGYIYLVRFSHREPNPMQLKLRSGIIFEVKNKNSTLPIITEIWHDKVYGDLREVASEHAPVIIDIGANIGTFSLFALLNIPDSTVYAFEPEPQNFNCLKKNTALNTMERRCTPVQKAICGEHGKRVLYLTGENSGTNTMFDLGTYTSKIEVSCMTLEEVLTEFNIPMCHFLKIDCEGAEFEILTRTPEAIFKRIKRITLEWHPVDGFAAEDLSSFLKSMGYRTELNYQSHVMTAVRI